MIKDCLEIFQKEYEKYGDRFILDSYILGEGTYVLVGKDGQVRQILEVIKLKEEVDRTQEGYQTFCFMDYYSKLIDMNKPIDSSKIIHSNNYLSFFVKKESFTNGKLKELAIINYYSTLENLGEKYKKSKQSTWLYEKTLETYGEMDLEELKANQEWIMKNIFTLLQENGIASDKRYLKVFFEADEVTYKREGERYFLNNVFNAAEYNVKIEDEIWGMPNINIGLNAKKPYLKHKTRKNEVPYLLSTEEVMLQKKFFDYLMNEVSVGHVNIYMNGEIGIRGTAHNELLSFREGEKLTFTGYYLRIAKGKEVEVQDADSILRYNTQIKNFKIERALPIDYSKFEAGIDYEPIKELKDVIKMIHSRFFNNFMNYYGDLSDKLRDEPIRRAILSSREAFFEWFYKGNTLAIRTIFPSVTKDLIKNSIMQGQMVRAKEQWMLRDAVMHYFSKGDERMSDKMKPVLDTLKAKLHGEQEAIFTSDLEYFCAVGQVAYFLLSKNKGAKKTHALVNPILNARRDQQIKEILKRLFVKYNYDIAQGGTKFKRLYAMIQGYEPEGKINDDALLYGYLQDNLMYQKGEKENE